jgi:hypothetical protein
MQHIADIMQIALRGLIPPQEVEKYKKDQEDREKKREEALKTCKA